MLHSYQAELNGTQLIWIDTPPARLAHQRVVVVVEDSESAGMPTAAQDRIKSFESARGCLGHRGLAGRDQLLAELSALREDWSRSPLDGTSPRARDL